MSALARIYDHLDLQLVDAARGGTEALRH